MSELLKANILQAPGVVHGFTSRKGGLSHVPYAELNLSTTLQDDRSAVATNRRRVLQMLGKSDASWVSLKQVHGDAIVEVTHQASKSIEADALWTRDSNAVLAILVADCVPVLMSHPAKKVVGAAHAGWRGTQSKIVAKLVARIAEQAGSAAELRVALGPAIGPCCFQIGEDVATSLRAAYGENTPHVRIDEQGRLVADLWGLNFEALTESGVPAAQIEQLRRCTACEPEWFYSHRRDHGACGRQAGVIALA